LQRELKSWHLAERLSVGYVVMLSEEEQHSSKAGPEDGLHCPVEGDPELCMRVNDFTFQYTAFLF
jgi:hypothetical protein